MPDGLTTEDCAWENPVTKIQLLRSMQAHLAEFERRDGVEGALQNESKGSHCLWLTKPEFLHATTFWCDSTLTAQLVSFLRRGAANAQVHPSPWCVTSLDACFVAGSASLSLSLLSFSAVSLDG